MLRPELPAATDASLRPNLLEMEQPEHSKLCLGKGVDECQQSLKTQLILQGHLN